LTDLLTAYQQHKGDMDLIFKDMPIVNVLDDEERLKERLRKEIELGHIPAYRAFTHEPKSKQRARQKRALKEAKEAAQIHAQLSKQQTAKTENDLAIMIQQRNKKRMDSLIAGLEEKYAPRSKKASNKTRTGRKKSVKKSTEPSEEEFAALQAKLFGNTSSN
jgi:DnaJ family protein C protein 9